MNIKQKRKNEMQRTAKKPNIKAGQALRKLMAQKSVKCILCSVLLIIALIVVIRLILLLFPIKQFEIEGDTHYEINEIINASDLKSGKRLYGVNKSKAEKKLLAACPYIKSVNIKSKFPNKICFEIEEREAGWYLQIGSDFYALDYDLMVLLETDNEEELTERGYTHLVLPELENVICGEYPKFGKEDEHLIKETLKIIDKIRTDEIKSRLTYLNLENRFEIKMDIDGTYHVNFGDINDYTTKFSVIEEIINNADESKYVGGEINVINPQIHSFKPYYQGVEEE